MRLVFMGTPESAVPSLRRLVDDGHEIVAVWTQPDKPAGRGKKLHQSPVKDFAFAHSLPVHQPPRIKNDGAKQLFSSHQADAAIIVAYGKILPAEFLDAYRHGCINVHFSLLPRYRGAAPVNWAIVKGEKETGVTTMKVVAELDAGPILLQRTTPIEATETAPQLLHRLSDVGAELLSETVHRLENLAPRNQRTDQATFAPILKREDGLIDWSMDALAIERRVRGFQPWPGAYTTFDSRRLIIWEAAPERTSSDAVKGGQIVAVDRDALLVAAGESSALRVTSVQLEGSRRMSARDFINGSHPQVGAALGQYHLP
jgi:methionyl-tRNA formyltransferase